MNCNCGPSGHEPECIIIDLRAKLSASEEAAEASDDALYGATRDLAVALNQEHRIDDPPVLDELLALVRETVEKLSASEAEVARLRELHNNACNLAHELSEANARLRQEVEDSRELFSCRALLHRGESGYFFQLPGGAVAPIPSAPTIAAARRAAVEFIKAKEGK